MLVRPLATHSMRRTASARTRSTPRIACSGPLDIDHAASSESPPRCARSDSRSARTPRACGPSHANVASNSRTGLVPVDDDGIFTVESRRTQARRDSGCLRARASRRSESVGRAAGKTAVRERLPRRDRDRFRCRALRARKISAASDIADACEGEQDPAAHADDRRRTALVDRADDLRATGRSVASRRSGSAAIASTRAANCGSDCALAIVALLHRSHLTDRTC